MQILKLGLLLAFSPSYLMFECFKKIVIYSLRPIDIAIKKFYPHYINDITLKKEQITQNFKR